MNNNSFPKSNLFFKGLYEMGNSQKNENNKFLHKNNKSFHKSNLYFKNFDEENILEKKEEK